MPVGAAPALEIDGLSVRIDTRHGPVFPVDGVSFELRAGETLAIVGESGSGKTMTALAIMGLLPNLACIDSGEVRFAGRSLAELPEAELRAVRGDSIAMIHQDPAAALDPVMPVGNQIAEALTAHRQLRRGEAMGRARELLEAVGVGDASRRSREYPHQFSGGMKQRAGIAMAVANDPDVLIADEPTTALDVTIQAQILQLLKDLQGRTGMSVLLITHDLAVVADVADRVLVMYAGHVVECGPVDGVFRDPRHYYTKALLGSALRHDDADSDLVSIEGQPPRLLHLPSGCPFHPRCSSRRELCVTETPVLRPIGDGRVVACHYAAEWDRDRPAPGGDAR
ncbi:MAG: ABC transporter ATP-binding protein [Coriobacteriales bacterium]|nr:ABC transporter ATP-binding protein [Coriobacteriales bacterium]